MPFLHRTTLKVARQLLIVTFVGVGSLYSANALAQRDAGYFVPSEAEWVMWPEYCKARYLDISMGQNSPYAHRMSRAQVQAIKVRMRERTFRPVHHYCFAIGYLMRAKATSPTTDALNYNFRLQQVLQEGNFTLARMDKTDPIAVDVAYTMATAHRMLGRFDQGVALLEDVMAAQPELPGAYVALALLYRRNEQNSKAVQILDMGLDRVTNPSAELYYTAAIAYIEKNDLETAQVYAIEAYDLGYPLPGLKRKLTKLGYWPPETMAADENQ